MRIRAAWLIAGCLYIGENYVHVSCKLETISIQFWNKNKLSKIIEMMGRGIAEEGWRKGPWTPEEDKLLSEYVKLNGEGRWSYVSRHSGKLSLSRLDVWERKSQQTSPLACYINLKFIIHWYILIMLSAFDIINLLYMCCILCDFPINCLSA